MTHYLAWHKPLSKPMFTSLSIEPWATNVNEFWIKNMDFLSWNCICTCGLRSDRYFCQSSIYPNYFHFSQGQWVNTIPSGGSELKLFLQEVVKKMMHPDDTEDGLTCGNMVRKSECVFFSSSHKGKGKSRPQMYFHCHRLQPGAPFTNMDK